MPVWKMERRGENGSTQPWGFTFPNSWIMFPRNKANYDRVLTFPPVLPMQLTISS